MIPVVETGMVVAFGISIITNVLLFFKFMEKSRQIDLNMKSSEETIAALRETTELYKVKMKQESEIRDILEDRLVAAETALKEELERYAKLQNQKKSSEVRLGQIGEHLAPFLDKWPWDSKRFRFLGKPIDGIQFDEDQITFVEIKTGHSQLNKRQRNIRDLIKEGKVSFAIFRIGEEECQVKEI